MSNNQSVTNCNRFGNAAKMREALSGLLEIVCVDCKSSYEIDGKCVKCPRVVAAEAALSAPTRNCDIGTVEEQAKRFYAFCGYYRFQSGIKGMCSSLCPCIRCRDMCHCITKWAQLPYEEGGANGK